MSNIPAVVSKRLIASVPKFKKILISAREKDVNESDTVTIITDMLDEIFGFDKYSEITREYAIQGTYCDLAIKTNKKIEYLIEVKAIGLELNDKHLKQAVNYASREGIKWVVLTNGIIWEMHRVTLDDKVQNEKIFTFDLTEINPKKSDHQELLFLLCKRGVEKDLIDDYYEYRQSVNRYTIAALLLTDSVTSVIRRELRKLKPGIKVETDEIAELLKAEVIKRETIESEPGIEANKQVAKFIKKQEKEKQKTQKHQAKQNIVNEVAKVGIESEI